MGEYNRKSREERIQEIQQAALKIFLEKGYRNTTMEDIVLATSLSKGGLYHYYGSTKEIIFEIMKSGNNSYFCNFTLNPNWSKEDVCAYLAEMTMNKILIKMPQRKLYTMFICEILYDSDFEELFFELEEQSFEWINQKLADFDFSFNPKSQRYYSRFINALLICQNIYSDAAVFLEKREHLYQMVYNILLDMIV